MHLNCFDKWTYLNMHLCKHHACLTSNECWDEGRGSHAALNVILRARKRTRIWLGAVLARHTLFFPGKIVQGNLVDFSCVVKLDLILLGILSLLWSFFRKDNVLWCEISILEVVNSHHRLQEGKVSSLSTKNPSRWKGLASVLRRTEIHHVSAHSWFNSGYICMLWRDLIAR